MYEINLVPDVKTKMLKTLKQRNLIFFICIIVIAVSIGAIAITGGVVGGQQIAINSKEDQINSMSKKLKEYDSLDEFLTIQDQLSKISDIIAGKKVLSRVFNILDAFRPQSDTVTISDLNIDLETATLSFEAQADAVVAPLIDYRVLEAYKKGMSLTKYDYGRYVDAEGNEIPTRCIKETDDNGEILTENGSVYAIWTKSVNGCDPAAEDEEDVINEEDEEFLDEEDEDSDGEVEITEEETEPLEVRIWRTPQFNSWYKDGYMDTSGEITDIPHFVSECIVYSGIEDDDTVKWTAENNCMMLTEDPNIRDSSNGRDMSGNLVLRFSATIQIDPTVFAFGSKHVMAIGPTGQNVTDSYRQVEGLFAKRAEDCSPQDTTCLTTSTNNSGE